MGNTINKEWHLKHKMPANATTAQRLKWHIAHAKHCKCRPMSAKLMREIKQWEQKKQK